MPTHHVPDAEVTVLDLVPDKDDLTPVFPFIASELCDSLIGE